MESMESCYNVCNNTFLEEILPANKPVILKAVAENWESVKLAKQSSAKLYSYLKHVSHQATKDILTYEADKSIDARYFFKDSFSQFNFKQVKQSFPSALERIFELAQEPNNNTSIYTGSVVMSEHTSGFEQNNSFPFDVGQKIEPRIWLGNSSVISTHFDTTHNVAFLVSGKREFCLFPTEQIKNLYPAPFNHTVAGAPMSMVDVLNPDFDKHPLYKEALEHALVAKLSPGDAIFIPPLWWHNVRAEGDFCALVNYFWSHGANKLEPPMNFLLHGLYTMSHLTETERQNWKELVDYFVFKTSGEPMSHVPPEQRGMFSDISPDHAYDIRDYMLRQMGFNLGHVQKGKYSK